MSDSESLLAEGASEVSIGDEVKSVSSPLAPHFKLSARMSPKMIDEREYMSHIRYASAAGSLMYAMMCTKPDLS